MIPKLLTRYVMWEFTKIFIISACSFVPLILLLVVTREAQSEKISPLLAVQALPFLVPKALSYSLPPICLFTVCVVFGRMSAEHEVTAIQAMGIHKSVLFFPVIVLAFLVSLLSIWLNDIDASWGFHETTKFVNASFEEVILDGLRTNGEFERGNVRIEVEDIEMDSSGARLITPTIVKQHDEDPKKRLHIEAEDARLKVIPAEGKIKITFTDPVIVHDGFKLSTPGEDILEFQIPNNDQGGRFENPDHLYMSQIRDNKIKQVAFIKELEKSNANIAAQQLLTGDLLGLTNVAWETRAKELEEANHRLSRLNLVTPRRWASGFACLAFAVIGIPIALKMKTVNYTSAFGMCFFPILVVYYPIFETTLNACKEGTLHPYGVWTSNLLAIGLGAFLLYRESKSS
ncbi:MAG: YjgP/YjgQ family permease [Planctomycetaceae bacterium]|nr:YjgP/YjgQ family permease [Planctomycetaceae bacterium]